jgi:hypothetical protein
MSGEAIKPGTPLPWQINGSHIYGPDPERYLVAQFLGGRLTDDRNYAVHACNEYPALKAKAAALAAALEAVVEDRDSRSSEQERFVTGGQYGEYWSPSATFVGSAAIASARQALAAYRESGQ